jgi:hypothetical protein
MTQRERVIAAIECKPVDRVPWIPECSWSYFAGIPEYQERFVSDGKELVPPKLKDEALAFRVAFYTEVLKGEFMQWCANPGVKKVYKKVKDESGYDGDRFWNRIETPIGTLSHYSIWSYDANTWFPMEDLIKTKEDVDIYTYVMEDVSYEPDYESLSHDLSIVGDKGIFFSWTPAAPLKSLLLGRMRLDQAAVMLLEEMERLFKINHAKNLEMVKLQAKGPAKVFMDATVTGVGMASPRWIREYYTPYSKEYHDIMRAAGKLYQYHTSGEPILAIADEIAKSGVNLQYGIAVPPRGEAPLSEIRKAIGPHVALSGGLEPAFLALADEAAVRERTWQVLEDMKGQNGLLLGTADDVPREVKPELLAVVGEVAREFAAK